MSYDSEDGKDAWKRYRRMVEAIDPPMQEMLHEFGSEQFAYGYAAGVQAAYSAVELRWQKVADAASDWLLVALAAIDALRAGVLAHRQPSGYSPTATENRP